MFRIIRDNIVNVKADAIVNSANPEPIIGGGAEKAIYEAAGAEDLLEERKMMGRLGTGSVFETSAFGLDAMYIFHTVCPRWKDGKSHEEDQLRACYENILQLATERGCESVAFPLLGAGSYQFPRRTALRIAREVITSYLEEHDLDVILVVFDTESYILSKDIIDDVTSYIDANYAENILHQEYRRRNSDVPVFGSSMMSSSMKYEEARENKRDLKKLLENADETFSEMLLRLIDEKGYTDPQIYTRANIDRKLFSKIRSNKNYHPKKSTAVSLALALGLSMDETKDLLARAGYALSSASKTDLILEYCIENDIHNIFQVNEILFDFRLPTLSD